MKFSLKWMGDFIETDLFFKDPGRLATESQSVIFSNEYVH